jgi:hypothetical protein
MLLNLSPHSVIAVGVLLSTLASVAVGLRFLTRHHLRVALREDDWTFLISADLLWGLGITDIAGAALGALDAHSERAGPNAPRQNTILRGPEDEVAEQACNTLIFLFSYPRECTDSAQIVLGYSIVETITFGVIKINVLLAHRRIFRGKAFNIASLCMIVICTFLALSYLISSAFQCHVRSWSLKYLDWSHRKHCIQAEISWSGYAIPDVITDFILLRFPILLVWRLQL